jgi:hypothetical protein
MSQKPKKFDLYTFVAKAALETGKPEGKTWGRLQEGAQHLDRQDYSRESHCH